MAKCLTGRPKTVEKAQAAFMLWLELEVVDVFLVCLILSSKNFFFKLLCDPNSNLIYGDRVGSRAKEENG